jgi:predicted SnoaL-like aldol condensation-catalyzing enzyme
VLQGGHLELTSKYMADGYIQHNINVPTGREGFVKFFSSFMKPTNPIPTTLTPEPVVKFAKGDFVLLVWEREDKDPKEPSKT